MRAQRRARELAGSRRRIDQSKGDVSIVRHARIVATVDLDAGKYSPREFREHARLAWLAAIDRARASQRIGLAFAEELIRAWPPSEVRR